MTKLKSFHKLVKSRQIEIVKASDPARNLVDKIFKTNVAHIKKSYRNPVFIFEDKDYIYKVFYRDMMFNGIHFKNDQHMVNMYVKFFQNYDGDMQLSEYYLDDNCAILQIHKLPGIKIADVNNKINIDIIEAGEWFAEQCIQIHSAGMRCVEKHKEFQIERNIFDTGYYFVFSDWNKDNILYDQDKNKLYLIDLQPINWLPADLWNGILRSQWKEIYTYNWKRSQLKNGIQAVEESLLSNIKESIGKIYLPNKVYE